MSNDNKMKSTKNNKNKDGAFRSKHVKHGPNAESARAVFGLNPGHAGQRHNDSE